MKKFYIIGIDDNGQREFQAEVREIITTHRVFSGGKRHYELMRDRLPEQYVWIDITVPLEEVFEKYAAYCEVVVFASGDPLFFGFANTVKSRLPEAEIQVFPWFNSYKCWLIVWSFLIRIWRSFPLRGVRGMSSTGL